MRRSTKFIIIPVLLVASLWLLFQAARIIYFGYSGGTSDETAVPPTRMAPPQPTEPVSSSPLPVGAPPPELPPPPVPLEATPTPAILYAVMDEVKVTRYPTLETQNQVNVGQEFTVQISLTEEQITPDVTIKQGTATESGQLELSLPAQDQWDIDVALSAEGFTFRDNRNTATITLPQDGDSTPALFYLTPQAISEPQRARKLYATLWYQGKYLAKILREITVAQTPAAMAATSQPAAPTPLPQTITRGPAATLAPYDMFLPPDLTVYVVAAPDANAPHTSWITISSPMLQLTTETFPTPTGMADWLNTYYTRLSRAGRGLTLSDDRGAPSAPQPLEQEKTLALLKGLGKELYQKATPAAFKYAFWTLKDKLGADFDSIQIFTNDPTIPWELMRPVRPDGSDEQDFLGITFRIARWHVSQNIMPLESPPPQIALNQLLVISPEYSGAMRLPGVATELTALQQVNGFERISGKFDALRSLFASGSLQSGMIHYAGHGTLETSATGVNEYAIHLEDGALDVMTWRGLFSGTILRAGAVHPFFFFNACDLGQAQHVANFVNGWAPAVLESGASGYIGGLWPLGDDGAATFAARFYHLLNEQLAEGSASVADILRQTRKLVYETGDPTFLAYVYYGYPDFVLLPPSQAEPPLL